LQEKELVYQNEINKLSAGLKDREIKIKERELESRLKNNSIFE
jgi:hypothetical protein